MSILYLEFIKIYVFLPMYPLTLIRLSRRHIITVELKNNEIYTGTLVNCDLLMNIQLKNIRITDKDVTRKVSECYIKGSFVKHIKLKEEIMNEQEMRVRIKNREK
ncbi:U6 snRNA-associated Sm-like protein [Spraguea lophii 42_110]|uniref:LSM complex subunit LSM4 n=1 Tax=Spraguea lophii (strain 42_110) TaxID=1358809 RepID=S7XQH0_SPRLO|nr:U6 snRNA-associated Sm-like protein [Spraguea lophii 42_110]